VSFAAKEDIVIRHQHGKCRWIVTAHTSLMVCSWLDVGMV
jgi:hypothetical protein